MVSTIVGTVNGGLGQSSTVVGIDQVYFIFYLVGMVSTIVGTVIGAWGQSLL